MSEIFESSGGTTWQKTGYTWNAVSKKSRLVDGNTSKLANGSINYCGAFQDSTTQTIASTTVAYVMTLNTVDYSNGVTVESNPTGPANSRVVFQNSGVYNIQWSGQFQNANVSIRDVSVWLRKNGSDVTGSTGLVSIPNAHGGNSGAIIVGWNYILQVNAEDWIEFVWNASSTAVTLAASAGGTTPTTPSTASLIITATQV